MHRFFMLAGLVCILVCLTGQAVYGLQYFDPFTGYSVDAYPYGIAAADLNGDSNLDLVTANDAASSISVLLGNGNGSFAPRVNYSTGTSRYPDAVTTGDIDGNGTVDIVTGGTMGIVIFYGVGDGTFAAGDVYYFVHTVYDVAVADLNNDSRLDIVTSNAVLDSVGIHLNNGDSTFTTHFVPAGDGTISLATAYLDTDNYVDILVGCSDGTVWNLQNDQSGSFIPTMAHFGILGDPAKVAVTDINGDGKTDFAVTHSINDFLYTFLGNGDGTYEIVQGHILTDYPSKVAFCDVNFDNLDDIFVCIGTTNSVELYLNQGSNIFAFDTAYSTGGTPRDMVFGDFNGDTYPDMAAATSTTDAAAVLLNRLSLILSVDDVDTDGILPNDFSLEQNYPNPFNPETRIRFALPFASQVKVEIFNTLGQSVRVLVDEYLSAGVKEVTWDGRDASGQSASSGVYLYRMTADHTVDTKTMVLLK